MIKIEIQNITSIVKVGMIPIMVRRDFTFLK